MNERTRIQNEIIDSLPIPSHGKLLLAPRVGKTRIAIQVLKKEKPKSILWVTPSEKLRDVDIPNEFNTWRAKTYLKKTKIICWNSLAKEKGHYDKIILDEQQKITEASAAPLLEGRLTYGSILCLSGTDPKHENKQEILKELGLKSLSKIGIEEAVDKDLIADYQIKVVVVPMDRVNKNIKGGSKAKPFMTTEGSQYDYLSRTLRQMMFANKPTKWVILKRLRAIYDSPTKEAVAKFLLDKLKGRKLMFAGGIEQSNRLSKNTFNSKTDDAKYKAFADKKIDHLICVNSGGTGHTYKEIDHLILIQANSDKGGETTQKVLRSMVKQGDRKACIWIICLADTQDEKWVSAALENFDKDKVEYTTLFAIKNQLR